MTKNTPYTLKKVTLVYPNLQKKSKFGNYDVLLAQLTKSQAEDLAKNHGVKVLKDDDLGFNMKASSQHPPRLYDSKAQPVKEELNIGNGTVANVNIAISSVNKTKDNKYWSTYVTGVQILSLVEYDPNPFEAEEGDFEVEEKDSRSKDTTTEESSDIEDDEIPFQTDDDDFEETA